MNRAGRKTMPGSSGAGGRLQPYITPLVRREAIVLHRPAFSAALLEPSSISLPCGLPSNIELTIEEVFHMQLSCRILLLVTGLAVVSGSQSNYRLATAHSCVCTE